MNNKNGYMMYELLIAFILSAIVSVFLIGIVIELKTRNDIAFLSTQLTVIKSNMLKEIYEDLKSDTLVEIEEINNNKYKLIYSNIGERIIELNHSTKTITYGDYIRDLPDEINLTEDMTATIIDMNVTDVCKYNSILEIRMPIEALDIEGDYGVNVVYQFDSRVIDPSYLNTNNCE